MKKPAPFGKYYLLERINVGGMAEVFRAKAFGVEGFERLVAVKRILPNIAEDKEFIRMFIEEAKLAVQLNHANIAQIFDLGVVDGSYYIALEHVHGRDLRGIFDRCRSGGEAMPVSQACFVVMKVCEGLDYAHNKRDQNGREISLVHRDVSPQNVLVSFEGEVKIIDFGIAKAAGKGSKTQAGILKGKFGYMSPEQVRGLPIDRRSDVFSCGIVLYELLTGERLFVGESDFSTLEKVRNVEILPPSTYNRKIPDELERIVLKALAKDVEDRYQNAIDLHDELQAFVYTAGEFYSRKDLAGWMKKTFGKEIEDETAKLETYRQLKPPPQDSAAAAPPAMPRTTTGPRSSGQMPALSQSGSGGTRKPTGNGVNKPPPPPPDRRSSGEMPVVSAKGGREDSGGLAWDEDELETQIYDNPEDDPRNGGRGLNGKPKSTLSYDTPVPTPEPATPPAAVPALTSRGMPAAADPRDRVPLPPPAPSWAGSGQHAVPNGGSPDLSSLVSTARGWESGQLNGAQAATMNGMAVQNGFGSSSSPPPPLNPPSLFESGQRELPHSGPVARPSDPYDPMGSFGSGFGARQAKSDNKKMLLLAGGAVVAVAAVVLVIVMSGGPSKPATPTPVANKEPVQTPIAPPASVGDANTGFDLYVSPQSISSWKLDGEARTDKLPSRIRGIAPGVHTVQIDPPAGFLSETQSVSVEQGKAPRVNVNLSPIQGIKGTFETTPPGAKVSLIIDGKRQELGVSPQTAPLDPRMTYQVLFEMPGFVSVNKPIQFSGGQDEKMSITLEKAAGVTPPPTPVIAEQPKTPVEQPKTPVQQPKTPVEQPKTPAIVTNTPKTPKEPKQTPITKIDHSGDLPKTPKTPKEEPPDETPKVAKGGSGTLMLGSKPSCDIFIDGSSSGLHTPQREIKLSAGKHKVTLVNNEFGIKESFTVDIKADEPTKAIKDYSDKLPK
ncbi:MAG TPA: protein kinase [Kofleriaceae bacterium]